MTEPHCLKTHGSKRPSSLHGHPPHARSPSQNGQQGGTRKTGRHEETKVTGKGTHSLVRLEAGPLITCTRASSASSSRLTCDVQVEGDLLAPSLAAVLPSVHLARLLHHQLPGAALGLHTHFRAGTQLLPVLVPRHLRLGLGHLAAQRGTRPRHGLHFTACWLLLGEHHRGLWGQRDTQDQRPHLSQDGSPGQRRPGWGGTRWLGSTMVELETSQALHQPCALQRPPCLSQQVTQFTHSPTGP